MKNTFLLLGITAILSSCSQPAPQEKAAVVDSSSVSITRGEYLVNTSGCNDCHSPKMMTDKGPVPDPALLLSGHPENLPLPGSDTATSNHWILFHMGGTAAKGPWGTSFAANLTPDPTGLGNWSEEQFFNAMRKGYYKGIEGGRMLLPLMPWPAYAQMTDEDLRSIFAYLKSLPPVKNIVPAPLPPGA